MFKQYLHVDEAARMLTGVMEQPSRGLILDTVAELRKAEPVPDTPGLGRWALSVPFEDWVRLRDKYPDLASRDARIKSAAWLRFIKSAESEQFKVRGRV